MRRRYDLWRAFLPDYTKCEYKDKATFDAIFVNGRKHRFYSDCA